MLKIEEEVALPTTNHATTKGSKYFNTEVQQTLDAMQKAGQSFLMPKLPGVELKRQLNATAFYLNRYAKTINKSLKLRIDSEKDGIRVWLTAVTPPVAEEAAK